MSKLQRVLGVAALSLTGCYTGVSLEEGNDTHADATHFGTPQLGDDDDDDGPGDDDDDDGPDDDDDDDDDDDGSPGEDGSCGDAAVQADEECDHGAANDDTAACKSDCTFNVCGDGFVGPGEGCDDGNLEDDDACTAECALPSCGDGVLDPGEECDDGNDDDTDGCTSTCTAPECGDGLVQAGEACDDGAANSDHGACTTACVTATCGDGLTFDQDGGTEECDQGDANGPESACLDDCTLNVCGDGFLAPTEACDDGNTVPDDGCSTTCELEGCGNGMLEGAEQCDDGANGNQDDGCTDQCLFPACGDGIEQPNEGEDCDDGPANGDTAACTSSCEAATCGDGHVWSGVEQCDNGAANGPNAACTPDCTNNVCGDGYNGPGEQCDDGNDNDADGCTNACTIPPDDTEIPSNPYCNPVADWNGAWEAWELEVITLVNNARSTPTNCGTEGNFPAAPPVTLNGALTCSARSHSKDMGDNDFFSHTNLAGQGPGVRIDMAGYDPSTWGENIAAGQGSPAAVVNGWLDSDGHCANIMNASFTELGVGYYFAGGSTYGHYWTQNFGAPL